ncbi:MAG: PD40 domain-containing protein [Thermoflexales bacterium]|nr:PD40 domain-containing protein [Thermoflexales bacterium]
MYDWSTHRARRFHDLLIFGFLLLTPLVSAQTSPPGWQDPRREPDLMRDLYGGAPSHVYDPALKSREISPPTEPAAVVALPTWTQLAFQSFRNDNWDIYLIHPDGSGEVRLTSDGSVEAYPALKRGCERVLFVSDRSGNVEIYAVDANGANLQQLSYDQASDTWPAWSPDGTQIAFQSSRAGNSDLFVMNGDGSNVRQLTSSGAFDGYPSWSPDGAQIVFSSNRTGRYELWITNADGSNQRQLTSGAIAFQPAWSPSGDKIAYANDGDDDGWLEIWQVNVDGTAPTRLYDDGYHMDRWAPAWSPDGQWLAYVETNWISYQGEWYWTYSYMRLRELGTGQQVSPANDDRVWKAHWASADASPPGPCTVNVPNRVRVNPFIATWSAEDVGGAGVASYDVQVRSPAAPWRDFFSGAQSASIYPARANEGTIEFRCRARDRAGNVSGWTEAVSSATLDATNPGSSVSVPMCARASQAANIQWSGYDSGSGIASYDVFVREGDSGNWTVWKDTVTHTQAVFTGIAGRTYSFRSQARDLAGHTEPWQPTPQASLSFYSQVVSVTTRNNRGDPVMRPRLDLAPSAPCVESSPIFGRDNLYLDQAGHYALQASAAGYGILPPMTLDITRDMSLDLFLPPQDDAVRNGGFEAGSLGEWSIAGNGAHADAGMPHSGAYALKLVSPATGTLVLPYVVTQTVALGQAMHEPTLSFMYNIPQDLQGVFSVWIVGITSTSVLSTGAATEGWVHAWTDLSAYAGQSITLSFELSDTVAPVWIDEVSVGSWRALPHYTFLPLVSAGRQRTALSADWPTLGYDAAHSGYNSQDPGASRYALAWTLALPSNLSLELRQAAVADGVLAVSHEGSQAIKAVIALDANNGRELWRRTFYDKFSVNPPTSAYGAVYVQEGNHGQDSYLFCLDLYTGRQNWQSPFSAQWELYFAPLVIDGAVYVNGGYYGGMYGYNAGNGAQLWFLGLEQEAEWTPAYAHGRLYTWVNYNFRSHDPATGLVVWSLRPGPVLYGFGGADTTPVIAGQIALVVDSGRLYAIDLEARQVKWSSGGDYDRAFPAVADGVVYALSGGTLEARRLADGVLLWSFSGDGQLTNAPLVAGNHVYVASTATTYVLGRSTHDLEWQTSHGGWLTVANGFLYIAQTGQALYAYRAQEP